MLQAGSANHRFDQEGNVVQAWGGPGSNYPKCPKEPISGHVARPAIPSIVTGYEWPEREHSLCVETNGKVWLSNSSGSQIVKFTNDGKLNDEYLLLMGSLDGSWLLILTGLGDFHCMNFFLTILLVSGSSAKHRKLF